MKKTSLITVLLMMAIIGHAQQMSSTTEVVDSLQKAYKKHKTAGLVLLPVGGAAFVGGVFVVLVAGISETSNDIGDGLGQLFGGEPADKKNYSGQYITGAVMMIGGGILAIVGATQLSAAHKLRKKMLNANVSIAPSNVPALGGPGHMIRVPQTAVTIKIPIGK